MKKLLTLALAAVLALSLWPAAAAAASRTAHIPPSTRNRPMNWTEYLSVTYKDGVITDVDFDAKDATAT